VEAILMLEDGRLFRGRSFGASGEQHGELVFNTAMTGYQEILTDPSYHGQIVVMTYPEIGNYGTNAADEESDRPHLQAFVVREIADVPSSWRARQSLPQYLRQHGIPGISEVDTRAVTRHVRERGAMKAIVSSIDRDPESLRRKIARAPALGDRDLVRDVTRSEPARWVEGRSARWSTDLGPALPGEPRRRCVAYDFGVKRNSLRMLTDLGLDVTVVPATASAEEVLALSPDALFLSNGPGDPEVASYAVAAARQLVGRVPVLGICLGHQLAALALGARTFKLKFGHHGANHPVKELATGRVEITSQNHGYAVDPDTLPPGAEVTHVNLNDGTCEGFRVPGARLMAVQYHPESAPGPHDAHHVFREFRSIVLGAEPSPRKGDA
jgi:carbamoyl-phosphate synthase small subunit